MDPAEKAEAATREIEGCRDQYLGALRALNDCPHGTPESRLPLIRNVSDKAAALHHAVERAIAQTDLLRLHNRSEVWATDLAATACNVLETIPSFYSKMRKEYDALGQKPPQPSVHAFYTMQAVVARYHPSTSADLNQRFKTAQLPVDGFSRPSNMKFSSTERWTAIITGAALLAVMLIVAIVFKDTDYNNFNLWVFRIVTSLAVAIVGAALLPGILNVTHRVGRTVVRATGGFGLFVLAMYVNPPKLIVQGIHTSDEQVAPATK